MNYELAKELWAAGFSFKRRNDAVQMTCLCKKEICEGPFGREFRFDDNLYPEPTLEELIEACGETFGNLERYDTPGVGTYWMAYDSENMQPFSAPTPTEAVARFWLALHKSS
jgi:hypothetical protein